MSLVNLAHVCSHLQNATKVRLGLTSIPVSKMHVALMLGLQKEGFLSSVTLGGPSPPLPFKFQRPIQRAEKDLQSDAIQNEPELAFAPVDPEVKAEFEKQAATGGTEATEASSLPQHPYRKPIPGLPNLNMEHEVPANPAKRRLWVGLKYWRSEPVLSKMNLISKPTKRIWCTHEELREIVKGRNVKFIKGIVNPGECIFVTTDKGILEIRECIKRHLGGTVLCRVS